MNLYDVMMGAQGGQGVNTLAGQFGLSPQQTQAAIQAMLPAFSLGLQHTAQDPTGFGALLGQMTNGVNAAAYANPALASAAAGGGGNVLGQIFGSPQIAQQIGLQAAQASGVSAQVVQQMMPLVASMLMGGIATAMAAQGLGGMMAQLANAFASGAGLNTGGNATNPAANAGNLMGVWMSMVGGMLSGAGNAMSQAASPPAPPNPQTTAMLAGLNSLNSLFQAGVQVSQAQQQGLNEILNSIGKASKT